MIISIVTYNYIYLLIISDKGRAVAGHGRIASRSYGQNGYPVGSPPHFDRLHLAHSPALARLQVKIINKNFHLKIKDDGNAKRNFEVM